jgi:hypothetical protein
MQYTLLVHSYFQYDMCVNLVELLTVSCTTILSYHIHIQMIFSDNFTLKNEIKRPTFLPLLFYYSLFISKAKSHNPVFQ